MVNSVTAYQAVPKRDEEKAAVLLHHRSHAGRRKSTTLLIFLNLFLSFLWLAPIVTLLYFNFSSYVIGASLWCPHGSCFFNPFKASAFTTANQYDHSAHNLLGVLQLVAKALEVWFVFVAAGLVYILANWLASRPSGLPLGLHATHVEFSDLRLLLDLEFWQTPRDFRRRNGEVKTRKDRIILYLFVVFCAMMCLLSNLMGPAVAVLVLPTLRQILTPKVNEAMYAGMGSGLPPTGNSTIPYCVQANFDAKQYDCSWAAYGTTLDAWVASGKAYDFQIPYVVSRWPNGTNPASNAFDASQALFAVSQEWAVSFAFNASANDNVFYAPNRQVLRNMTADLENFAEVTSDTRDDFSPDALRKHQDPVLRALVGTNDTGFVPVGPDDTFEQLRDSLQTQLQRSGPVVGASINFYQANSWTITKVTDNQFVLCSQGWSPLAAADPNWNGTKCLPVGKDWPDGRDQTVTGDYELTIPFLDVTDDNNDNSNVNITLQMFWANKAAYFNDTSGADIANQLQSEGCLITAQDEEGSVRKGADCDWTTFFNQEAPDNQYPYILSNVHTILIEIAGLSTTNAVDRFVIEFSPSSTIADYVLDTSPFTNAIRLVELVNADIDNNAAQPIYIHPAWLVAMFSGDVNTNKAYVDAFNATTPFMSLASTAAQEMAQTISDLATLFTGAPDLFSHLQTGGAEAQYQYRSLFYISYLTTLHLCSMLSFNIEPMPQGPVAASDSGNVLYRRASITVWAYGIDSRTSVFGVVIAIMGAVVVLTYVILGLILRTKIRGPTELLAAALAHDAKAVDPFVEVDGQDDRVGRVRYTTARTGTDDVVFEKVT